MPEHTPVPTPSRAVYGFVMFLSFNIFFLFYLVWAVVPECYFHQIGIDFLPQRNWAVSVPIYILTVLMVFAFVIYPSLGLVMTPNINDMRTITDKVGKNRTNSTIGSESNSEKCVCTDKAMCWKEYWELGKCVSVQKKIPVLKDIEMWEVSKHLYLRNE